MGDSGHDAAAPTEQSVEPKDFQKMLEDKQELRKRDDQQKIEVKCRYGDEIACRELAALYRAECSSAAVAVSGGSTDKQGQAVNKKTFGDGLTACSRLANMYLQGVGVDQSIENAIKLYEFGCEQNHVHSCFSIGTVLLSQSKADSTTYTENKSADDSLDGKDSVKARATDYLTAACFRGHGAACNTLAQFYSDLRPRTSQSVAASAALFHRACEMNHMSSCSNFGLMCLYGIGLEKPDLTLAKKYLERACDAKFIGACDGLKTLAKLEIKQKQKQDNQANSQST